MSCSIYVSPSWIDELFMLGPTSLKADTVILYNAPGGTLSRAYEVFSAGSSTMLVLSYTWYCRRYPVSGEPSGSRRGAYRIRIVQIYEKLTKSCLVKSGQCCVLHFLCKAPLLAQHFGTLGTAKDQILVSCKVTPVCLTGEYYTTKDIVPFPCQACELQNFVFSPR